VFHSTPLGGLMLRPPVTISIAFVRGMLSGARARGHSRESFLADAGITPELIEQPGARVTAAQYTLLFRTLIDRLEDEGLGFFSRSLKPGSFALVVRSALGAPTLDTAMRRIARTFWLLQDDVALQPLRHDELAGLALRFVGSSVAGPPFFHELLLRTFWRSMAWLAGGQLRALRFDFAFEWPPYAANYAKIFPAPLFFEQQLSAFWFDAARLQRPVLRDEASLRTFLEDAPSNIILPRLGGEAVTVRVLSHLRQTQPEWPDLVGTAEALHMSMSTLQRHLASEGTSFQSLKDELRRDIAVIRLNTSMVSLAELADELGFADGAAFQRAFKCWTGSAPGTYRRGRG
jgi:AraC-like DNA-binding protein